MISTMTPIPTSPSHDIHNSPYPDDLHSSLIESFQVICSHEQIELCQKLGLLNKSEQHQAIRMAKAVIDHQQLPVHANDWHNLIDWVHTLRDRYKHQLDQQSIRTLSDDSERIQYFDQIASLSARLEMYGQAHDDLTDLLEALRGLRNDWKHRRRDVENIVLSILSASNEYRVIKVTRSHLTALGLGFSSIGKYYIVFESHVSDETRKALLNHVAHDFSQVNVMSQQVDKKDQVEAMDIVQEDEETKQKRIAKETITDIKRNFSLLERSVETIEARFTTRVLRTLPSIRRRLTSAILGQVISEYYGPNDQDVKNELLRYLNESDKASATEEERPSVLPEVDMYIHLNVLIFLLDKNEIEQGIELSTKAVERIVSMNRRTMDQLAARIYFYHARFHELTNRLAEIRPIQLAAHRTATLRHDVESQATLLNLLLRNYFYHNLYDQADKLVSKTVFPEKAGYSKSTSE
ncbi:hypothetical protein RMATCC62417_16095 [Rhizopus microsporus]|nr:hypothetical protein RMATCC62417_16095 [Rhizopus microsporus]